MEEESKQSLRNLLFGKIGHKIFFSFLIIILMGVFAFFFINNYSSNTLEEYINDQLKIASSTLSNNIETLLEENEVLLELIASDEEFVELLSKNSGDQKYLQIKDRAESRIADIIKTNSRFVGMRVIDSDGKIIASTDKDEIGVDLSNDKYFIAGKESSYISEIHSTEKTGEPHIKLFTPVRVGNRVIGVLAADYSTEDLFTLLENREGLGESGENYLVNNGNMMVSPSRFIEDAVFKQKVDTLNVRNCFEHKNSRGLRQDALVFPDYRGISVLGAHVYIKEIDSCLLSEIDEAEAFAPLNKLRYYFIGLFIVFIFVFGFFGLSISRKISRPIKQLHDLTKEVEKGNFSVRVDIKTGDELEELGEAFNKTTEALSKTDEERKNIEKAKTEFLSITSHELRSPMTPMKAQLQMILGEYFGKINQKQKESLEIVLRNTTRLDNIIQDLLEVSRIEAARLKFKFVKTTLSKHIANIVKEMEGFLPDKKIRIGTKIEKLPIIEVDPDRVGQVLRNLLNNAKKFSPENSTITVTAFVVNNMIQISVSDQGVGLTPEDQRKIFEPFYQVDNMYQHKSGGTGLGLAIIRGIVESQNGRVWLESKVGKGTTFHFTVPLKPVRETKSIKLLFSSHENIEKKIKELFINYLGPMGETQFREMGKVTTNNVIGNINQLEKVGIITVEEASRFRDAVIKISGQKSPEKREITNKPSAKVESFFKKKKII